ncbi:MULTISPECIES: sensor histidine kinase [unclassified Isoptericola]|uniref:sensor histidine kinase n=1 Tax=Isoptericola sp. NPDC057191 TaxID=3346041 RepID=UPI0036425DE2
MVRDADLAERRAFALIAMGGVALVAAVPAVELALWGIEGIAPISREGYPLMGRAELAFVIRVALLLVAGVTVASALSAALLVRLSILHWSRTARVALVVGLSLGIGIARTAAVTLGLPRGASAEFLLIETALAALEASFAISIALYYVGTRRRIREEERRHLEQTQRATLARVEAEQEELRVRREISRQLHGGLQQRLVLAIREVDAIHDELEQKGQEVAAHSLEAVSDRLDELRESEVRAVAHALYPLAGDFALSAALLLLADRLPPSVTMDVRYEGVADALLAGYSLPPADRVMLFSVVEEGVNNAMLHGRAHRISVVISGETDDDGRSTARLTVDDDGTGLPDAPELSGVARLRARAWGRGGELTLGPSPLGGARLSAVLPVQSSVAEAEGQR